jgi:hypothetical protein
MASSSRLLVIAASLLLGIFFQAILRETIAAQPALQVPSASSESAVLKRVLANSRAREERIKSFYCDYDSRSTSSTTPRDPADEVRSEVWMDGDNRYQIVDSQFPKQEPKGSNVDKPQQAEPNRIVRYAFDGSTSDRLVLDVRTRQGDVWNGDPGNELASRSVFPLMLALRPYTRGGIERSSKQWRVVSENAILDNKHCVKIQFVQSGIVETYWIDSAREDVVVGWEQRQSRSQSSFVSIEYQHDEKNGWMPARWTETRHSNGGKQSSENTMTQFSINGTFPRETFTPAFPPGTTVVDRKLIEKYVVAKDGSKVDVLKFDSPGSLEIHETLETQVDFAIDPEPLKDALEFIASRYQIQVVIDPQAVKQGLIDPSIKVKVAAPGIRLRSILNLLLEQSRKPLGFEVRKGTLVIIPVARPE